MPAVPSAPAPVGPLGAPTSESVVTAELPTVGTRAPTPVETPAAKRAAGALDLQPVTAVRVLITLALGAAVATYVAVEVDLIRRHFPGIPPEKYWWPQLQQITLPGLGAVAFCALVAYAVHRLGRRP